VKTKKKKIKQQQKNKPDSTRQNLTRDEALALTHTPGAVTMMKKFARLLLAGYTITSAAARLKRNRQYLVSVVALPEFKTYLAELEADYFNALDRRIKSTLDLGINALIRQLRNKDWRARDSAIEKIFRLHGRYIDRIDVRGSLSYSGQVTHQHGHHLSLEDTTMTDEMRQRAMEFLNLARQQQAPKALPPRFTDSQLTHQSPNGSGQDDDDTEDGRGD
jgi:hypothetical protein